MYSSNGFEMPESKHRNPAQKKKWFQKWWGRLILLFLFLFLTVSVSLLFYVGSVISKLRSGEVTPLQLFGEKFQQRVDTNELYSSDDPQIGAADAKVVIVEFSDFQCPFCKQSYPVMKEIIKNYGDKILFVYKDFPLTETHTEAVIAALAGQCAHEQGKFWQMHDKIFENQENLKIENLKIMAVQVGLNSLQFDACMQNGKYIEAVQDDLNLGVSLGISATPTFFINGKRVQGALPLSFFESAIISELSK